MNEPAIRKPSFKLVIEDMGEFFRSSKICIHELDLPRRHTKFYEDILDFLADAAAEFHDKTGYIPDIISQHNMIESQYEIWLHAKKVAEPAKPKLLDDAIEV